MSAHEHKRKKRDAHHILFFLGLITGAILTIIVSVLTLTKVSITNSTCDNTPYPNSASSRVECLATVRTSAFGWPFRQVDGEAAWPTLANWIFFSAFVFGVARAEVAIKGHLRHEHQG